MKLEFAIFANAAEVGDNGLLGMLGGGVDLIKTTGFPAAPIFLNLVAKIFAAPDECGKPCVLRLDVVGPSKTTQMPDLAFTVEPHQRKPERGGWAMLVMVLGGVSFASAGDYTFRFLVDGVEIGQTELEVIQVEGKPVG